jgi:molecular chaperone DnaK (HSP70)
MLNGILTVSAIEKSSGLKSGITISSSLSLSDKEVDELVEKTEKLFVENKVIQEKTKTVAIINDKITEMAEKIEQVEDKDKKEKLVQLNADTMEWLENNSKASLTELQDKQKSVASAFALVHDEL